MHALRSVRMAPSLIRVCCTLRTAAAGVRVSRVPPLPSSRIHSIRALSSVVESAVPAKEKEAVAQFAPQDRQKKKKTKGKVKKGESEWEQWVVRQLEAELREENRRYARIQAGRATASHVIRHSITGDGRQLVALLNQLTRDDAVFGVAVQVLANCLEKRWTQPGDTMGVAVVVGVWQVLQRLKTSPGHAATAGLVLLAEKASVWSAARPEDRMSEEIREAVEAIGRKADHWLSSRAFSLSECGLVVSAGDRAVLERRAGEAGANGGHMARDSGYEEGLSLVDHLRLAVPPGEYRSNAWSVEGVGREDMLRHMDKQLQLEAQSWIKVDNLCKERPLSVSGSAEQLIEGWRWRERIEQCWQRRAQHCKQYPLRGYLSCLTAAEVAEHVSEAVTASVAYGQNLLPYGAFLTDLTQPVLRAVHAKFIRQLGVDEAQMWRRVFADYSEYFVDAEVARTHTHRQWWEKCARRHGLKGDEQMPLREWHGEAKAQLGKMLVEVVSEACTFPSTERGWGSKKGEIRMSPAFSVRNVSVEEESVLIDPRDGGRLAVGKMVSIKRELLSLLDKHQFDHILFPTDRLPLTVPPRPWLDAGVGGPEFTRQTPVLRTLPEYNRVDMNHQMRNRLKSSAQARPVMDALNQLGATPWRINEPLLEVLCEVFSRSSDPSQSSLLETLSVPMRSETVALPDYAQLFGDTKYEELEPTERRDYAKAKAEAVKKRNELNSMWYWLMYRLVLARHYRGQTLYFPHNMDFRGRVYPISPHLSHMGDDVNRCLLRFAKGKRLGADGLRWLRLHVINLTGKMKRESVDARLVEAAAREADMVDSADRPLDGRGWWLESEEPWQTLAACVELRDALKCANPEEFVSHLPVHQDGSCNGLQHYAALGRDAGGGAEVNLLYADLPADVYSSVAVRVEQKRVEDESSECVETRELAEGLRKDLPQAVPRKVIKQTVMTTVYGVTMYGAVQQIKRQLKALGIDNDDTARYATYLANKTFASLNDAFTSSMQLKDWFRECARGCSELGRAVEWVTPLGLPVTQPYLRVKEKHGRLILQPVPGKQVDAFPPNFVHSLDSTHMMLTSLDCSRRGVTFAAVHDCFWTHACTVDEMNVVCREQFVRLHQQKIAENCSLELARLYLPPQLTYKMTEADLHRFRTLFTLQVKPGELDIEEVKKSVYFFS